MSNAPSPNESSSPTTPAASRRAKSWRVSVWLSIALHVVILAALVWIPYQYWLAGKSDSTASSTPSGGASATDGTGDAPSPSTLPPAPKLPDAEKLTAEQVQDQLEQMRAMAEKMTPEEQRERLDKLGERFENISSPQAVNAMSERMQDWLGTEQRASRPSDSPVEGVFDHRSAQVHDVVLRNGPSGDKYVATLVDSAGRSFEVQLDDQLGRDLHETFSMIKKYPLLEQVYRNIAMPLFDQILDKPSR